ncbi:F-box/TPR repeat protein pof3 [Fusarium austroafricanum]|uniref:F-box/TPR repeat protein pof3 n=1 Tax=Fusarium austroafricanum TaxID=2364996 RepID=A0A8H4P4C9_9HYPO|nr:F-box/TPR repeat protein pof3 [Fusarium austroafricanum]
MTSETQESAIAEGRRLYGAKQYKPALKQFTKAMQLCICTRQKKRPRCSCKNFEKVASEGGSIFHEAMYTCDCVVRLMFSKCDHKLHIQALDYRAATFEEIKELERAQRDAEWMLELAPRLPDGYLRLGKISRLQKNYEFAWKVYSAGIEVGNKHRLAESPKFQKLRTARQPLHIQFYRRDPLKNPQEIVQRIFDYLDFASLVRCTGVSKGWRQYLASHGNERLWRTLFFKEKREKLAFDRPPGVKSLKKLISFSANDVRQIIIEDVSRFKLTQHKLNVLLQGSKNLEHLELKGSPEEALTIQNAKGILKKLNHIILQDIIIAKPQILKPLLLHASESLKILQIHGLPQIGSSSDPFFPHLPSLQCLRLEEPSRPSLFRLSTWHLAFKTPRVQQLYLNDVQLSGELPLDQNLDDFWPELKVVTVHGSNDSDLNTAQTIQQLTSLRGGRTLQYIDFDFRWKPDDEGPLGLIVFLEMLNREPEMLATDGDNKHCQYADLRSLRLRRAMIPPLKLQKVLGDTLISHKLHTLDLAFPLDPQGVPEGSGSTKHIQEHAWLRGEEGIKCIGLSEFRFRAYPKTDDEMYLPGFLASFPNLEVLEINSSHYEPRELCIMIEAILKVTHLQKIYQKTVHGEWGDQLRKLTAKNGVELIWGDRPRQWPLTIES